MVKTAYFAFSEENRATVRTELQAAAAPEAKVSVAEVAKALGRKWRALDDAEKERYKTLAQEQTRAAADAAAAASQQQKEAAEAAADRAGSPGASNASDEEPADDEGKAAETDAAGARAVDARPVKLPASIVKRIMCMDDDVERVSAGALRAVGKAAELFLGLLTEKGMLHAAKAKRRTLKFVDIRTVAQKDKRLVEMGLQDVLDHEDTFAEARGDGHEKPNAADERPSKRSKKEVAAEGAQPITSFFKAEAAADQTHATDVPNDSTEPQEE